MPKKIRENEISEAVRSFLREAFEGGGVVIEDETGRVRGGVMPYRQATPEEQEQAWNRLRQIQQEVGDKMRARGETEADLDRILREEG